MAIDAKVERPSYMVVGAYGGVGSALARRLHEREARLFLVGRDGARLSELAQAVEGSMLAADASSAEELSAAMSMMKSQFGTVSGVACVTGCLFLKPAHLTSAADWSAVLAANLTSAFNVVATAAKAMMGTGGSIVLMSSAIARVGLANHEALSAAKAGVEGLVRSAAATYARHGIRVNCVAPGVLDTAMTADVAKNAALLDSTLAMYAISRMGTAQEVACVIDWLLGEESGWVTGQAIVVDGGLSTVRLRARATS